MSSQTGLVDIDIENDWTIDSNESTNKTVTNGGHDYTEIKFVKNKEGKFVPHSGGEKVKCTDKRCGFSALACSAIAIGLFSIILALPKSEIPGAIFFANIDDGDQATVTANTILVAIVVFGVMVTAISSCLNFWIIRHFKPEKNLDGQIDYYARENVKLKNDIFELQGLGKILNRRLEMIKQLTSSLEENQNSIRIDAGMLDYFDDKLVVVAENFRQTVKEKDGQLKKKRSYI